MITYIKILITGLLLISSTLAHAKNSCDIFFDSNTKARFQYMAENNEFNPELQKSYETFTEYFEAINSQLVEREFVLDLLKLALISKEHVLIMGPPGNAKSLVTDKALGNIKTVEGEESYFRIQMTPETTFAETHGPIDPVKIFEEKKFVRMLEQGMLMFKRVFIDEIFDAGKNSRRNILGALAEREHNQSGEKTKGLIQTAVAASNKYISQVYRDEGESVKAVLDRFVFKVFFPKFLEKTSSTEELIDGAGKDKEPLPELTDVELENINYIVTASDAVEIPSHVSKFLILLRRDMMIETESKEINSVNEFEERVRMGENPEPPYRPTKFLSDRTVVKASIILKAMIVLDWLQTGQQRSLTATIEDVQKLESVFTLNAPKSEFLRDLKDITVNQHEISQIDTILYERETFQGIYKDINEKITETLAEYGFIDVMLKTKENLSETEKQKIIIVLANKYIKAEEASGDIDSQLKLNAEMIGSFMVKDVFKEQLSDMLGEAGAEKAIEMARNIKLESERATEERRQRKQAKEQKELEAKQLESAKYALYKKSLKQALEGNREAISVKVASALDTLKVENGKLIYFYNKDKIVEFNKETQKLKEWDTADYKDIVEGTEGEIDNIFSHSDGRLILTSKQKYWVIKDGGKPLRDDVASPSDQVKFLGIFGQELLAMDGKRDIIFTVDIKNGTRRTLELEVDSLDSNESINLKGVIGALTKSPISNNLIERNGVQYILENKILYRIDMSESLILVKKFDSKLLVEDPSNPDIAYSIDVSSRALHVSKVELTKDMKVEDILEIEDIGEIIPGINLEKNLHDFAVLKELDLLLIATHNGVQAVSLRDKTLITDSVFNTSSENGNVYIIDNDKIATAGEVNKQAVLQFIDLHKVLDGIISQ